MRNIAMRFTAIGLSTLVWALPAVAQTRMPNDRAPVTRSDDDAEFDSADAPDNGNAPMANRRPKQGRPVQNRPQPQDPDEALFSNPGRCPFASPAGCMRWQEPQEFR
jgi:hypothetical protein